MNKKSSLILWIIAIVLVITAASVIYSKNKPKGSIVQQPGEQTAESTNQTAGKSIETSDADQSTKKTMAPDFSLKDMSGKDIKLSDYRGKIVIINFWAVWCKYCIQEMPDLNELNKELQKENNVVILAIDSKESKDTVKKYLDKNNISLKVLLDSDGATTQTYGITGFPTTFVVNRDGSLYTYISGATNKETLLDIINKVK